MYQQVMLHFLTAVSAFDDGFCNYTSFQLLSTDLSNQGRALRRAARTALTSSGTL